ncbi:MAG: hypothetical protein IJN42_08265 [Clostridia bacterium]|nr:hypothetical protein [Clostridia bacterium]
MKNKIRLLALLVLSAVALCSLGGCASLKDMRAAHGIYTDETYQTVLYNKTEYRRINDQGGYLRPHVTDMDHVIYLTEQDVPVLLSESMGVPYLLSEDETFIISDNHETPDVYCRADRYDEIAALIVKPFAPTHFCYTYYKYDEQSFSSSEIMCILTEEQSEVIRTVLSTVPPTAITDKEYQDLHFLRELEACTEDALLRNYALDIYMTDNAYYLVIDQSGVGTYHPVPADLCDDISEILKPYLEHEEMLLSNIDEDETHSS